MVKQKIITLLLLLPLSFNSLATDSLKLKEGDLAPYDGYLIDEPKIKRIIKENKEAEILKEIYKVDQEIINKQQKSIDNLLKENKNIKKISKYDKYVAFIVGVLVTGFTIKVVK